MFEKSDGRPETTRATIRVLMARLQTRGGHPRYGAYRDSFAGDYERLKAKYDNDYPL